MELLRDRQRPVTTDADEPHDAELPERDGDPLEQNRIDLHPLPLADERREPALVA